MAKQLKLKTLLEDIFNEQPQINKYEVVEGVRSYGVVGKALYNNGNIMDNATSSCTTDGSQLINSTYNINITFEVIEGDIIEIQVWYEGWDNIEFYYGSEMYPSGFYISGLELPELILGCTNTTANNYDSEATEDDGSCLFNIMDDGTSLTDIEDGEVSFSFPNNFTFEAVF